MVGDILSAYLMAETKEKVFFIAGHEFGDRAGHLMVMRKACYGLKTSGKRYHDLIYDVMSSFGFKPSLADADISMRDAGDHYGYVCIYTDDITYIGKHEDKFFDELRGAGFDLKDVIKNPTVFLGGSVSRDADGTLAWGAKHYIDRSLQNKESMTGSLPHKANIPMHSDTHPELDMFQHILILTLNWMSIGVSR